MRSTIALMLGLALLTACPESGTLSDDFLADDDDASGADDDDSSSDDDDAAPDDDDVSDDDDASDGV